MASFSVSPRQIREVGGNQEPAETYRIYLQYIWEKVETFFQTIANSFKVVNFGQYSA